MTAVDLMTAYPQTVRPDTPLIDAASIMERRGIRHLPVVDRTSTLVGMLSERDVHGAAGDLRVADVMSAPPIAVPFDASLQECARHFTDRRVGALPVIDRFGALLGILSYVDLLRPLARAA